MSMFADFFNGALDIHMLNFYILALIPKELYESSIIFTKVFTNLIMGIITSISSHFY
jgi:hypothetical protein